MHMSNNGNRLGWYPVEPFYFIEVSWLDDWMLVDKCTATWSWNEFQRLDKRQGTNEVVQIIITGQHAPFIINLLVQNKRNPMNLRLFARANWCIMFIKVNSIHKSIICDVDLWYTAVPNDDVMAWKDYCITDSW